MAPRGRSHAAATLTFRLHEDSFSSMNSKGITLILRNEEVA
jgi:hypothetical protein